MKKNSFIIFLLLLIFSCENMETVVDLDVPETPPVLVLNAMLDTDVPVTLLISHSVGAFPKNCLLALVMLKCYCMKIISYQIHYKSIWIV